MGARAKAAAGRAATKKGREAFEAGKARTDNPYRPGGIWNLRPYWDIGWRQGELAAKTAKGVA